MPEALQAAGKNWKTTLVGALAAAAYAWANAGNLDASHIAMSCALAAFGFLTKDASK